MKVKKTTAPLLFNIKADCICIFLKVTGLINDCHVDLNVTVTCKMFFLQPMCNRSHMKKSMIELFCKLFSDRLLSVLKIKMA